MAYPNQTQLSQETEQSINRMGDDLRSRASRVVGDMSERARHYAEDMQLQARMDEARFWLRENRNTVFITLGVVATAGIAGYFLSRRRREMF